jgi:hypothetical protein
MTGSEDELRLSRLAGQEPPHPHLIFSTRVDRRHPLEIQRHPHLPNAAVVVVFSIDGTPVGSLLTKLPAFAQEGIGPSIKDIARVVGAGITILDEPMMNHIRPPRQTRESL